MDDGSIDYYYNDIFDYNDDARAGAIKSNPFKTLDGWDLFYTYSFFFFNLFSIFSIGCNDALPGKFSTESSCKKLKQTCTKLKNKCTWKFNGALGNSNNAKTCKNKLGWYKNRKVEDHCKITCKKCGNFIQTSYILHIIETLKLIVYTSLDIKSLR